MAHALFGKIAPEEEQPFETPDTHLQLPEEEAGQAKQRSKLWRKLRIGVAIASPPATRLSISETNVHPALVCVD